MKEIRFDKVGDPYGYFSNFSPHTLLIDGNSWPTVEHFFQASKFSDIGLKEKIRSLDSPYKAAEFGKENTNIVTDNWENEKEQIMIKALKTKFLQHPDLKVKLLLTGDTLIILNTIDQYWGNGGNGKGKNRLGLLLMHLRDDLKEYSKNLVTVFPPWIAFPSINQHDLFWKMGMGEDYLVQWAEYYFGTDITIYQKEFPEPEEWRGFYEND